MSNRLHEFDKIAIFSYYLYKLKIGTFKKIINKNNILVLILTCVTTYNCYLK